MSTRVEWRLYPLWAAIGIGLALLIVALSLGPPDAVPPSFAVQDKVGHFAAYATLAGWNVQIVPARRHGWLAAGCVLLGIGLELGQGLTAERTPDVLDAFANTLGVAVGALLGRGWMGGWLPAVDRWAGTRLLKRFRRSP